MSNLCPICLKNDFVHKVSGILTSESYTYKVPAQGEIVGYKVYGSVEQRGKSDLAQALAIPTDKDWKAWKGKQFSAAEVIKEVDRLYPENYPKEKNYVFKIGCLILGALALPLGCAIWLLSVYSPSMNWFVTIFFGSYFVMALFPLSWVGAWMIYQVSNPKEYREKVSAIKKSRNEYYKARRTEILKKSDDIERQAITRSEMLYYCSRDDVVFLPGTSFCVNAKEMKSMSS